MRKIDLLHRLQEIDNQTDAAHAQITKLSTEIGERRALDELAEQLQAVRSELHGLESQQRDLELQADRKRELIAEHEGKLYGGRVRDPKELTSLSEEVAQDKRQLNTIEDQLLNVLEQVDAVSKRLAELEASFQRKQQAWKMAQEEANARLGGVRATLATLESQRAGAAQSIDAPDRAAYDTLRRQKGGVAIATVHQRTCQACRVGLTPVQEQRARIGNELVTCNSCGRILYVPLA